MARSLRSIQPYLLLLVFFGPLLLAALAYYGGWDWLAPAGRPHGQLISPTRSLPDNALAPASAATTGAGWADDRWSLIYLRAADCTGRCVGQLNRLNQVRLALGADMPRAQVVLLLAGTAPVLPEGAEVLVKRLDTAGEGAVRELLGEDSGNGQIYIADPRGTLVLRYPPDAEQKHILEDLERLLQLAKRS